MNHNNNQCFIQERNNDNPVFWTVSSYVGTSHAAEPFVIVATLLIGMLLGLNIGNSNTSDWVFQAKYISFFTLGLVLVFLCPYTHLNTSSAGQPGVEERMVCCGSADSKGVNTLHMLGFGIYGVGLVWLGIYEAISFSQKNDSFPQHELVFAIVFCTLGVLLVGLFLVPYSSWIDKCRKIYFVLEAGVVVLSLGAHMIHDVGVFFDWF